MKFPKLLGDCIDAAYTLRAKRLALEKQAEAMRSDEAALREHIIQKFKKSEIEGAKGKLATSSIARKTVAAVKDWAKFTTWMAKTKSWDMVQRRVNDKAYNDRLAANMKVPGLEPFEIVGVHLTKIGKRGK